MAESGGSRTVDSPIATITFSPGDSNTSSDEESDPEQLLVCTI